MSPGPRRRRLHSAIWRSSEEDGAPPRLRPGAVYPLLAAIVFSFGINWPIMSTGLQSISALWMAALRLAGAAVTLFAIALATRRLALPPRADYPVLFSVAVFRLALVFVLVFAGLEIVPAGRSSILVWTSAL